jgi:transketolase
MAENYLNLEVSKKSYPFMRDVFIDTIYESALKNKDIYFTTPDMGAPALVKFRRDIPNQFIHSGICEQHMIAMAAGLSLMKKKVICYAMAPFITSRCYEQIKCSVSAMETDVTLVGIGVGLGYADAGPTHYTTEDISTMRAFPNIEIITPADEASTKKVALECIKNPKFRFVRLDREALPPVYNDNNFNLHNGYSNVITGGKKCVITCGKLLHVAKEIIEKKKLDFTLIDLFRIKPFPLDLTNELSKFTKIITLEEQCLDGGFGSAILEILNNKKLGINIDIHGLNSRYYFENGGREYLMKKNGLDIEAILTQS